ncbi:hypothetical protein ACTFIZ_008501 [Dictyostelium cf. discoideum]
MNIINIFIILLIFYLFKSNYKKYIKKNKFEVNGPFPLPIIGNLHQITNKPHIKCHELVKQYGDIFRVYLGDTKTIMVSDYKIIEELFIKNHNSFLERPITPSFSHCSDNQNGLLLSNEKWVKNREMVQKAMKKGNVKNVYEFLNKQINDLIQSVKPFSDSGEPLNFRLFATRFTLSTMMTYIFNEPISYNENLENGTVSKFCTRLENIFVLADVGHIGDYIDFLKPIYSLFLNLTDSNVPLARDYVYKKFYEHLKTIDNEKEENYDLLHAFIKEIGVKDKESVKSVVSNSLDLLVAGTDTAAKGIEWIVLRIANNQDVQEIIYKELKSVVNGCNRVEDRIYLTDRSSTPYLNATIKESMRITPITPYGIPRVVGKDLIIKGHFFPKGSHVVINYRALNHNESVYKNPNQFNPNRFLDNNIESFIPYSIGNRNCVGQQIANHELFLFVSNFILNYKITPITNEPIDTTENFGINIRPNSFKINVHKRN